jgi:hypothetical protein
MRSDIVRGAIFPDYEHSGHTAKRRKLSNCKDNIPWFSSSAAEGIAPKTDGRSSEVTEYAQSSNKHFGRFGRSLRHRVAAHAATPASFEALGRCVAVAVQALPMTPRRVTARRANNPGWQDRRSVDKPLLLNCCRAGRCRSVEPWATWNSLGPPEPGTEQPGERHHQEQAHDQHIENQSDTDG